MESRFPSNLEGVQVLTGPFATVMTYSVKGEERFAIDISSEGNNITYAFGVTSKGSFVPRIGGLKGKLPQGKTLRDFVADQITPSREGKSVDIYLNGKLHDPTQASS